MQPPWRSSSRKICKDYIVNIRNTQVFRMFFYILRFAKGLERSWATSKSEMMLLDTKKP